MARKEYRVVYRREGRQAEQHRIFGLLTAANRFANKVITPMEGIAPVESLRVESRAVGPWQVFWDQYQP